MSLSPTIVITIELSGPSLALDGSNPFSVTISAYATGTNGRPLTVYAYDTLLHPDEPALQRHGLQFIDIAVNKPADRRLLDAQRIWPRGGCPVTPEAGHAFVEIPADAGRPYRATFPFLQKAAGVHRFGFIAGHKYRVELGRHMARVEWWSIGRKAEVLALGKGNFVRPRPQDEWVDLILVNKPCFDAI